MHKFFLKDAILLNHPANILKTTRDGVYALLKNIERLHVPKTVKIQPKSHLDVYKAIKKERFDLPVIFRQAGDHGGISTLLIKDVNEMFHNFALDGREYYLTQYFERSNNGLYSKYRLVVVDGEVYLRHVIFSKNWISINVATKQILHPQFESKLETLLIQSKADTSKIDVEITEYLFLEQNENNLKVLDFIHEKGMKILLDDFGTGYSSLSYLKKFPIDVLKIDKVFMDDCFTSKGAVFVETIVKMGQTLNLKIIAEGVETKEQVAYLKGVGCDAYQGYHCSKPLSVKEFELFYKEYVPTHTL